MLKKSHLFLNNMANLYIRRTWTNIFVTITDMQNQVLICKSSGMVIDSKNKRLKKAPQSLETIVLEVSKILKENNIHSVNIILKSRITQHIYTLVRELLYRNISVASFINNFSIPYGKLRERVKRRK